MGIVKASASSSSRHDSPLNITNNNPFLLLIKTVDFQQEICDNPIARIRTVLIKTIWKGELFR
ncbi:hypothetical protein A499_13516 [Niallia nealsonii AAU1]|nr:hypothetical protein A499_13516 [Niallia nealsonii AAU1]